ncbi:MAG: MaoC/PaaZ C-terminal domain-containing protein [Chromatiaceae bacterium]|jgi:acyl dehydratase
MEKINVDDYIKVDEKTRLIFLKRKALDQKYFMGSENPNEPMSRRIDELEPGTWTVIKSRHIAHNDLLLYASCGDRNRVHLSPEFAKESPFREIIAHGQIAVFKQRLLGRRILPGSNFVLAQQEKAFTAPVYVETSVLDFYEIVVDVDRENHRVTTLGLSVLSNDYDKIVLKTISTYVPTAIFSISEEAQETEILAAMESADPGLETTFAEPGVPNHFPYDYFKKGQWARMRPDLRKNHLYSLAGIGHMEGRLHLADELSGSAEFLLSCVDDAFRSAVLGTLLPAMGSIYQSETTKYLRPLKLGVLESRVVIEELRDSARAVSLGLNANTIQSGKLISSSNTRIFFPKPAEQT